MRIVIDTNCFLAIIPKLSPYRSVFDAYRAGTFELAVSTEVLEEYTEIFGSRMTPAIAENLLELIDRQANTVRTEIFYRWDLIAADYDDNKFVDCALSSGADFIITNDHHFDVLKSMDFPKVNCLTLSYFATLMPLL
ncbi:putative toxin-antitoxin system toxin component, PIN family [Fibrella forsythiae]|uniref:Toxin-antitoxin system toxin component, PIN family n=1 Tax=Fibrella forsythiae TaxID=2817061 RepID=A0ABS3JSS8_9BACT|nr:putative toxin-antitoxin system toxin component, PIN family [Fibrella forsythiae]MBO0952498.1 putative toxin-antitoxin system toxin component, PIN family [Fibrella forsythiae]